MTPTLLRAANLRPPQARPERPTRPTATRPPETQAKCLSTASGRTTSSPPRWSLVKNNSDHGGQTVTVSVNYLDDAGEIITTSHQVESFTHAGQTIAMQVWGDLGSKRAKVASIEPTLLVEDDGTFEESDVELNQWTRRTSAGSTAAATAKIPLTNPTDEQLKDLRIGVACRNAAGEINGGGVDYPELLPPGGQIMLEPSVMVSGKPVKCTAYPSDAWLLTVKLEESGLVRHSDLSRRSVGQRAEVTAVHSWGNEHGRPHPEAGLRASLGDFAGPS